VWDTSGQAVFRDTVRTQYRSANVIYFVFDVARPETLEQLAPYVKDAQAMSAGPRKRELILVGNKVDLRSGSEDEPLLGGRQVSAEDASSFVEEHGLDDFREVSAKTGANVKLTFNRSLAHAAALAGPSLLGLGGSKGGGKPGCAFPSCG
jgi:GTPase SAR1 family protein